MRNPRLNHDFEFHSHCSNVFICDNLSSTANLFSGSMYAMNFRIGVSDEKISGSFMPASSHLTKRSKLELAACSHSQAFNGDKRRFSYGFECALQLKNWQLRKERVDGLPELLPLYSVTCTIDSLPCNHYDRIQWCDEYYLQHSPTPMQPARNWSTHLENVARVALDCLRSELKNKTTNVFAFIMGRVWFWSSAKNR